MGDRYYLNDVKCECGYKEDEVYYAPTCGIITWECPKCQKVINLEKYSGINAEGCATTDIGIKSVKRLKQEIKKHKI